MLTSKKKENKNYFKRLENQEALIEILAVYKKASGNITAKAP